MWSVTAKTRQAVLLLMGALCATRCTEPNKAYRPGSGVVGDPTLDGSPTLDARPELPVADAAGVLPDPTETDAAGVLPDSAAEANGGPPDPPEGDAAGTVDGGDRDTVAAETTVDALPASLIGWWKLDESAGDQAMDSSLRGHHGEVEGITPSRWVGTPRGRGLEFPAGGVADAGLRVGMTGSPPVSIRDLGTFTIAAWARRSANLTRHLTVMSRQLSGDTEVFNLTFDNTDLVLYVWRPSAPTLVARRAIPPSVASDWIHVAATYNGASFRVFVDGVAGDGVEHTGGLADSVHPLYIGTNKNVANNHQPFEGVLDEVMLFSEALGPETIQLIRVGTFP